MTDFTNGFNITELEEERAEKLKYIKERMKYETNNRKTSKSQAGRVAIDGCYEFMKMLEEERTEKTSEARELMDLEKRLARLEL